MIRVVCLACGELGGQGTDLADALRWALANGFHAHHTASGTETYCERHRACCSGCDPRREPEPTPDTWSPRAERVDSPARIARLATMAPQHIVRSVRVHWQEEGGAAYTRAAVSELARRQGWDLGRATYTLEDVLEGLGLLAARAA